MKKVIMLLLMLVLIAGYFELFAQTTGGTSQGTISRGTRSTSRTGTAGTSGYYNTGTTDVIITAVVNMLRHSNKDIRMQAIQSLVGGMILGTTTTTGSSSTTTGIGEIFGMRGGIRTSSTSSTSGYSDGLGTTTVIPEFFTMLADPDPAIRDLVSIALDQIFGTDASLLRFMNDPDPVVRKYAIKLFVIRSQEDQAYRGTDRRTTSSRTGYIRSSNDILIMRILLNMMKDPDPDVKKVASDGLEKFISDLEKRYQPAMETTQQGVQPVGR